MNLTHNNPFRVLGLPLTASSKEIAKQVNTLSTYAEMGKTMALDADLPFLRPINRTPELVEEAKKRLEQNENRFLYSLFWFWSNNSVDELAWDVLKEGRVEKAVEIWEKALFANKEPAYKPVALYEDLLSESNDWLEVEDDSDHRLRRSGRAYVVERNKVTSYSIPTVYAYLSNDDKYWSIECDTEWLDGIDNIGYGIVFGKEKGSYFSFEIAASGYYRFDKYVDWNFANLIPWKSSTQVNSWGSNHLQITKRENQLSFYINGQFVDSCPGEPFFGNNVGFKVTNNQTIAFSNLKVCRIVEDETYGAGIKVTAKNFSHLKNLSVLYLSLVGGCNGTLKNDYFRKGAALANRCFSNGYIENYAELIAGDRYVYDQDKALHFYISNVADSLKDYLDKPAGLSIGQFIQAFSDYPLEAKRYIKTRFLSKPIQKIENEIESTVATRNNSPSAAIDVGKALIETAKTDLNFLRNALGKTDYQYQTIADRLANEIIQCAIDSFNRTHNDEPGLPLYKYGSVIAVSTVTQRRAKENLGSCHEWINNKIYYLCWFCGRNQPDLKSSFLKTVYKVTSRSYFPRSVQFSYGDIRVPRCPACLEVHNKTSAKYWPVVIGCFITCLLIGAIFGLIIDNMPAVDLPGGYTATGNGDGSVTTAGTVIGAVVGALIGWIAGERLKSSQLNNAGIKDTSNSSISQYPIIKQRLADGCQLSRPTA